MASTKITFQAKERLNWLSHLYYLRGEYLACEKVNANSDYSKYLMGVINLREHGDIKRSLKYFNLIHSTNENLYCKAIAKCIMLLGKHSQLITMLKKDYLKLFPTDWQLWTMLGISYLHQADVTSAKDSFQHALQTTNQIEPFLFLSQCHLIEGDIKSAIFVLRRATETIDKFDRIIRLCIARFPLEQFKEELKTHFISSYRLAPDNIELTIKLGLLLYTNGMKSKGVDKLNQLMYISANSMGNLQMSLAVGSMIQETQTDLDGALLRYKLANTFESPVLWNNVSLCFSAKKKYVAAISCLKRSLYLNVFDWRTLYNLGLLNLQLRQYSSAFHYLKAAVTMSGNLPNVFSLLAICLENLDDEINTRYAHEKAVKRASDELLPIPIINYCVYLYNSDATKNKGLLVELLMEFEQCFLKRKKNCSEFDELVMKTANELCVKLNVNHSHMAWNKDLVSKEINREATALS